MSSYYYRNENGEWFVSVHGKLTPVEDSASMEIAYMMGRIDKMKEILEGKNE